MACLVATGEKGSPEDPLTLDELGPWLSKKTGRKVEVLGFTPADEKGEK